tara:strand:+ start:2879 stop:3451 length:573 start_codon:yes stop_codon:yes gene_type:complete
MEKKRKVYAPFSLTSEAGVAQTPVEGYIDVNQTIYPTVNTGTVNENGTWTGVTANDSEFINLQKDEVIADGANIISVNTIDMFKHDIVMFALKVSNAGDYNVAFMVSGSENNDKYFNLNPVNTNITAEATVRTDSQTHVLDHIFNDTIPMSADVWHPVKINDCKGFKLIARITNNSGGNSNIEHAIMRIV